MPASSLVNSQSSELIRRSTQEAPSLSSLSSSAIETTLGSASSQHYHTPALPLSSACESTAVVEEAGDTQSSGQDALLNYMPPTGRSTSIQFDSTDVPTRSIASSGEVMSKAIPHVPEPINGLEKPLTPLIPSMQLSSPSQNAPSSPICLVLPSEATIEDNNPFTGSNSQQRHNNTNTTVLSEGDEEFKGEVKSQASKNHSKKENIQPKPRVEARTLKPGDFESKLKSHEASSNLSKGSPNHPSISSQNRSAKKIRTPFRSPLFSKTLTGNQQQPSIDDPPRRTLQTNLSSVLQSSRDTSELKKRGALSKIKGTGTTAARAAFKSPLHSNTGAGGAQKVVAGAVSSSHIGKPAPRNDPAQTHLQLLRRAVKIKESGEDEKLQELVGKWREVAKEVAWELWGLVKEGNVDEGADSRINAGSDVGGGFGPLVKNGQDHSWDAPESDGSRVNWGWDDAGEEADASTEFVGASDEMEEKNTEDEEEPKAEERSMGTMLRQLGIAQETLGWDEEEGDFTESVV